MGGIAYLVLRDMRGEPVDFGMMFKGFEKFVPLMVVGLIQAIPGIIGQMVNYGAQFADIGLRGGGRGRSTSFYQASGPDLAISSGILVLIVVLSLAFMV